MTLDDVLASLQELPFRESFAAHWDAAQAVFPSERPAFLQHAHVRAAWSYGGFEQPVPEGLLSLADRIVGDPPLLRFAWYLHWRVFGRHAITVSGPLPDLHRRLGDDAGLFYLVSALAFIPAVRAYHADLGLPEQVTRDTCRQVACFTLNHQRGRQGRFGVYWRQLGWLRNYLPPNLYFRLGRFEFWRNPYAGDYRAYRHAGTGEVVVLAADRTEFAADGSRCFDPLQPHPPGSWQSSFVADETGVAGHPIAPSGAALPHLVRLPRAAWTCALQPGDMVLHMHIPSGGGMTPDACAASFRQAQDFFRAFFPDAAPKAIVCGSWMLSNQLEDCLPPDAHLVRLLQELYLVPAPCRPDDGLWFVFLQTPFDPATAPRETRLQRAMLDYLNAGRHWHVGGMLLLADEIAAFGTQPYRSRWPPRALTPARGRD